MFACLWQVLWRHPAFHPEVRLFLLSHSRLISLPPELLHWPVLTSHPFVLERTPLPNLIHFYSFCFFCLDCFFICFFFCRSCHVRECLGVCWVCVFLRVCVFSPAASVDYGSFADRCSTWLELLRLKAHTIRRGSVKTSRRTHSLAHSGDHTYKFTSSSCIPAHIHPHTPPCMPLGAGHYQSSNQALAFLIECESWSPTLKNQLMLGIHDDKIIYL